LIQDEDREWIPEMIYQNNEGIDVSGISADENFLVAEAP
jgi:hypothetical protein